MLLIEPDLHCVGSCHFGDFCYMFLPNISENQKKSYHRRAGLLALCHGKSGSGYCITFMKRLDDCLRLQLLEQKPLISFRLYIYIFDKNLN